MRTPAERTLWQNLRASRLQGLKFRRQHVIGPYIADFCCLESGVIVELDGDSHDGQIEYDNARATYLQSRGFRVVRYTNMQVHTNLEGGRTAILMDCQRNSPS